ncbi:MAG: protein kinase [Gemmataceae bacterium]
MQPTITDTLLPPPETQPPVHGPRRIDSYEVLRLLGEGGMGVVYLCLDTKLSRRVALKMLKVGRYASTDELHRFRHEAEALSNFQHPHIVQVFDLGLFEGKPYLVMEYLEGGDLASRLNGRPLSARGAAKLVEALARAVQAAHSENIVHRDLKPGNVLIVERATVPLEQATLKISDFGLAKRLMDQDEWTVSGMILGTPEYMAPEQASGKIRTISPAADVYSLGAILYECLTGHPPFRGATLLETLEQVRSAEPASPSRLVPRLPSDLCTITLKCLQKDPARRYHTAGELADDLERFLQGKPIVARPIHLLEKWWRVLLRHPLSSTLLAASLVLLLALTALGWQLYVAGWKNHVEKERRRITEEQRNDARQQHQKSIRALRQILTKLSGPLRSHPDLDPLRDEMVRHFKELLQAHHERQMGDPLLLAEVSLDLARLLGVLGNHPEALESLDTAEKLFHEAEKDKDDDSQTSQPATTQPPESFLATLLLERGRLFGQTGKSAEARTTFQQVLKLIGDDPRTPSQAIAADAWHHLGELALNANDLPEAQRCLENSRDRWTRLQPQRPDAEVQRKLARAFGYLGDVYFRQDDPSRADQAYTRSHELRRALADPSRTQSIEAEDRFQLARSFGNFARMQTYFRLHQTAIHFHQQALALQEKLVDDQPRVPAYVLDLVETLHRIAELRLLEDEPPASIAALLDQAQSRLASIASVAQTLDFRVARLENHLHCARLLLHREPEKARSECDQAEQLRQKLPTAELRMSARYQLLALAALQAALRDEEPLRQATRQRVRQQLRHLLSGGYRGLSWADIQRDRAFQGVELRETP